jgi:hypothetical protein
METKKCEICEKELEILKQRIGSNKGGGSSSTVIHSDDGVYYEDGNCWFCNEHWKELFNASEVDYKAILEETE